MEALDYWRLCDELNIMQAALLVVGADPSQWDGCERLHMSEQPRGYEAAKTAITNALRKQTIAGQITPIYERDQYGAICAAEEDSIDLRESRVEVASLRSWLAGRGFSSGFFFPEGSNQPDYLDPEHEHYAPKLAAAIAVWKAVASDSTLTSGTSPKQAMMKWLRKHADSFGLTKDDGNPNDQGIEEIAKIANWDTKGGAPKTPG